MIKLDFPVAAKRGMMILAYMEVAGINFRKEAAWNFTQGSQQCVILEAEPDNPEDMEAIQVLGWYASGGVVNRVQLGYVPKEVARLLVRLDMMQYVQPRLRRIFVSDKWFFEVRFDLYTATPVAKKWAATFRSARGERMQRLMERRENAGSADANPFDFDNPNYEDDNPFDFK